MTRDELLDLYRRSGALLEGHFRLTSGLHSPGYLQCALVLQYPQHAETLARAVAERARDWRPTVVLSPALGGVVIGQEVGRALGVRAIFAERQDGVLTLRRGFTLSPGDRVLVVEDVLTTDLAVGFALGDVAPFVALLDVSLPTYEPEACPLCAQSVPVVKPGSRQLAV